MIRSRLGQPWSALLVVCLALIFALTGSALADTQTGQTRLGPVLRLVRGSTLRGTFAESGTATVAGQGIAAQISFGFTLSAPPSPHYIDSGSPPPPQCPGNVASPQARPGNLCIYEAAFGNTTNRGEFDPVTGTLGATPQGYGAGVYARATAPGNYYAQGTWAVTAH
jgi:hypothetical protein